MTQEGHPDCGCEELKKLKADLAELKAYNDAEWTRGPDRRLIGRQLLKLLDGLAHRTNRPGAPDRCYDSWSASTAVLVLLPV